MNDGIINNHLFVKIIQRKHARDERQDDDEIMCDEDM